MSEHPVQNYENHVRQDPMVFSVLGIYILALVLAVVGIFTSATVIALAVVVAAIGGVLGAAMTRQYGTKLQDRIVRLEMRLRLRELLPEDLKGRIADFTLSQLVALRFASDAELPELAKKVLEEGITKQSEIKKLITDWQADWHRV